VAKLKILTLSLWLMAATSANAQDVAGGRQIALWVCSVCHVVAPDQEFAPRLEQQTPSFPDIANNPKTSAASLRKFITSTHWDEHTIPMTMPNPMLSDDQTSQVVSYILSLRKQP
jgi:mono/diheme cytochrome c family protein